MITLGCSGNLEEMNPKSGWRMFASPSSYFLNLEALFRKEPIMATKNAVDSAKKVISTKTVKKSAGQDTKKDPIVSSVVVLPSTGPLPEGHAYCVLHKDGQFVTAKSTHSRSPQVLNEWISERMEMAKKQGYLFELMINGRLNYRRFMGQMSQNPMAALETARHTPEPRSNEQDVDVEF